MPEFLTPSQYFHRAGARPRKNFGQHFLAQPATAARIAACAELARNDIAVEIGPGLGALTRFIAPSVGRFHLVEIDREMAAYLRRIFSVEGAAGIESRVESGSGPENEAGDTDNEMEGAEGAWKSDVSIHEQDALAFDFAGLSREEGRRLVVLGNLPYNISSPLVFCLLEAFPAIDRAVFMVQKEVGERFAASPGTKDYGVLSVLLGIHSQVGKLFTVGPAQFYPPPKVDSIVIKIDFFEEAPPGPGFPFLRKLVGMAFQQRRKTLRNSLKGAFGISQPGLLRAFEKSGIDPGRRPETLTPSEFLALAAEIADKAGIARRL